MKAWRYIGYSFVHAGMEHIIVNMALMILVIIRQRQTDIHINNQTFVFRLVSRLR